MGMQYSYTRVPLSRIPPELDRLFSLLELDPATRITRSSNSNLLVLVSGIKLFREIDDFIESLALIHPCRFFIIAVDDGTEEICAEISARCHGLSAREQVCSEIVRLSLPSARLPALPELLRANLLPGAASELLIWDGSVPAELINQASRLADRVFFDSGQNVEFLQLADRLLACAVRPIDLEWLSLTPWREQMKSLADQPQVAQSLPALREVRLVAEGPKSQAQPAACLLLMAGWIASRLKLEVIAWEDSCFSTISDREQRVNLALHSKPGGSEARIIELALVFQDTPEAASRSVVTRLSLQGLETFDETAQNVTLRRALEAQGLVGKIESFFQSGYSMSHYLEALRVALELRSLQQEAGR